MSFVLHYRSGLKQERAQDWGGAAKAYRAALSSALARRSARLRYRLGFVLCKQHHWSEALPHLQHAVELRPKRAQWHYRLGIARKGAGLLQEALDSFRTAAELAPNHAEYHYRCADVLAKQKKFWQTLEPLETAIRLKDRNAAWFVSLAEAQAQMARFEASAEAYRRAMRLEPDNAQTHYSLGRVLEKAGRGEEAVVSYARAIELDTSLTSKRFGIGAFHQRRSDWPAAAAAYKATVSRYPGDAELWYRLGMALDRCHRWPAAASAFETALALEPNNPTWHYRLGFVRERMGDWTAAASAYAVAAGSKKPPTPYYYYRLGYVLARAGLHEQACSAFLRAAPKLSPDTPYSLTPVLPEAHGLPARGAAIADLPKAAYEIGLVHLTELSKRYLSNLGVGLKLDLSRAETHFRRGNALARLARWTESATAYAAAMDRRETHESGWAHSLGCALASAGRYEEACTAFESTRVLTRPHGVGRERYDSDAGLRTVVDYTEMLDTLPIRKKTILYESYHGARMSCSPYAIFRELLRRSEFDDWTHVWTLNDSERIPSEYRGLANVVFVKKESYRYMRYLAEAEVLINNGTFPPYFIRKEGQRYLNTWHGTPLKTLGKDIKGGFFEHKNSARNLLQASHIISPNAHTTHVLFDRMDVRGITTAIVSELGSPRIDLTLRCTDEHKVALRRRLGIAGDSKVVLYAPTFRGSLTEPRVDADALLEDIAILQVPRSHLLFRGHYFAEEQIADSRAGQSLVPADIDTNELLAIVDVLVTDYSSIAFDFLVTGRPIVYHVPDKDEYAAERGLYFDIEVMPGPKCTTREETAAAITRALEGQRDDSTQYVEAQARFTPHEDGHATERAVDMLLYGVVAPEAVVAEDMRTPLLFFGGDFIPNGITNALINLVRHIDDKRFRVVVVIDPGSLERFPERLEMLGRLPETTQIIGRVGRMNWSLEEHWAGDHFNRANGAVEDGIWRLCESAYQREYLRIFGRARFDAVVNFDGYNRFWPAILGFGGGQHDGARKAIYLHNDMYAERTTRFPVLEATFRLYRLYDRLVSVSEHTRECNVAGLAKRYSLAPSAFRFCDNLLDPERFLALAKAPLPTEYESLFAGPGPVFINSGRLSPEKGQAKLIRAFAAIRRECRTAKLVILGDGPLDGTLLQLVRTLSLGGSVHLVGYQQNPFSFVGRADCFVFSSEYEGQGLVLLEAMVLGRPIVCTDFPCAHDVLRDRYGLIVENSEEGLRSGMRAFLAKKVKAERFDHEAYNRRALAQFHKTVLFE